MLIAAGSLIAQAPLVQSLEPAAGDVEVDAAKVRELVIVFDRDMNTGGMSVVGGGPTFPKFTGKPKWDGARTLRIPVQLEADHGYRMSLNSSTFTNFRSQDGTALAPVPWSFSTLPADLRSATEQKKRNDDALKALLATLRKHYSYYDLRIDDWDALLAKHRGQILASRSDLGFAARAAQMLKSAEDIHMSLRLRDQTLATYPRAVDPLYREPIIKRRIQVRQAGPMALAGRTDDGIGYLMIASWMPPVDTKKIGEAIRALGDTKAMIVDVRPNSGGDETLAQEVAAWFVEGSAVYAKNRYRTGPGEKGFGKVLERSIRGHGGDRHYSGRVVVLTSRYVMSSNEAFVLMMKQAKDCVVVGQTTYGSSGNPKPFTLPNDVVVVVPTWQAMLPDGTPFEGRGIEPDVRVACTGEDFVDQDPILEAALEKLRAK